jgi:hypothetical protein
MPTTLSGRIFLETSPISSRNPTSFIEPTHYRVTIIGLSYINLNAHFLVLKTPIKAGAITLGSFPIREFRPVKGLKELWACV